MLFYTGSGDIHHIIAVFIGKSQAGITEVVANAIFIPQVVGACGTCIGVKRASFCIVDTFEV